MIYYFSQFCGLAEWFLCCFHLNSLTWGKWVFELSWEGVQSSPRWPHSVVWQMVLAVPWGTLFSSMQPLILVGFTGYFTWHSQGRISRGRKLQGLLKAGLWNSHNSNSAAFDWYKQLTGPAQILHPLMEVVKYCGYNFNLLQHSMYRICDIVLLE